MSCLNEIMDYFKVMKPHFCQFDDCSGIILTPLPYSFEPIIKHAKYAELFTDLQLCNFQV